jgi:protein-disulfide isomerase
MTSKSASRRARAEAARAGGAAGSSRQAKIQAATPRGGGANRVVVATVVAVVVIVVAVFAVISGSQDKQEAATAGGAALPKGAAAMGAGILVNPEAPAGVPTLDLYEDFQCPICAEFEHRFGAGIAELAQQGKIRLVVHTLSFLDDKLGNNSSNRAANAAACAADQGAFMGYHAAAIGGQPLREGAGFTDEALKSFAEKAGITGSALTAWQQCYTDKAHNQYVESVQTQSEKDKVTGTPTLRLNGADVALNGFTNEALAAQVKAATK